MYYYDNAFTYILPELEKPVTDKLQEVDVSKLIICKHTNNIMAVLNLRRPMLTEFEYE